jgi:N-formylmaleamate deformylase
VAYPESRFVDSGGVALRVLTFAGPPENLLLLPGITSPAAVWDFVAAPLSRDFSVHVLDLRGRGRSDAPATGFGLDDYAGDAIAVIEQLELGRTHVLGHSLGARIATALARTRPELVQSLVVVDPPVSGPERSEYPFPLAFYLDGIRAARDGLNAADIKKQHPTWTDAQAQARADWLGTCDERAVAETWRHFHDEDFHALWREVASPVLIAGGSSQVLKPADLEELLLLNPSALSIVVDDADHMIPWDQPDAFIAAVRLALTSQPTEGVIPR